MFIREESTLKHESIFLSLLRESYTPVGKFFRPPRWMMSRFSIPTGEALIVVHPYSSLCVHWLCVSSHMYPPLFVTFRYIHVVHVCDDMYSILNEKECLLIKLYYLVNKQLGHRALEA